MSVLYENIIVCIHYTHFMVLTLQMSCWQKPTRSHQMHLFEKISRTALGLIVFPKVIVMDNIDDQLLRVTQQCFSVYSVRIFRKYLQIQLRYLAGCSERTMQQIATFSVALGMFKTPFWVQVTADNNWKESPGYSGSLLDSRKPAYLSSNLSNNWKHWSKPLLKSPLFKDDQCYSCYAWWRNPPKR